MYRHLPDLRIHFARIVVVAATFAAAAPHTSSAVDDPKWKLPPGFTIEQVAGPPLVQHPTMGGFDDRGRLYICDGPGDNLPAKDLLERLPHSIKRLEDTDGDGQFDRVVTFADKLVFPMGALWHDGAVYTASPPHIWRLRDTDGDGVCDERKILVSQFGFTGNAADIHGCFLGPDGRLYWCDGRHGHTLLDEQGNTLSQGLAARLFSCKLDGSDVQVFAGGGMDNPVEVDFAETGEPLGTVAIYDNQPDRVDALIHWVYGGTYPYAEKVLGEFKRTGPLLPAVRYYGRVAPSGITRHRSPAWGEAYRDDWFHVQFNTHRMIRTKLTRDGATFRGEDEEFLVSDDQDVHLTDVIEDADGSLLVVDTGGWFRIACPNSQIAKPEIRGAIYRIRKTDAARVDDPWGLTLDWDTTTPAELINRLNDRRAPVRERAITTLVKQNARVAVAYQVQELLKQAAATSDDVVTRRNAVWALARIGSPGAYRALGEIAAKDPDAGVRIAALRGAAACPVRGESDKMSALYAVEECVKKATERDPAVLREYAATLARIQPFQFDSLFDALKFAPADRMLEHALLYGLIEGHAHELAARKTMTDRLIFERVLPKLRDSDPVLRRAALITLDQAEDPRLTRDAVAALLATDDARLQRTALEVMQRHPDWADGVLDHLRERLSSDSPLEDERELLRDVILSYKADARVQQIVGEILSAGRTPAPRREFLLNVIERSEFDPATIPPAWAEQINVHLGFGDPPIVRQAVAAAVRIGGDRFDAALVSLAGRTDLPDDLRVAALGACGGRLSRVESGLFSLLTSRLAAARDPLDRAAAAKVLGILPLDAAQVGVLVDAVAQAGALELPPLIEAFSRPGTQVDGKKLVAELAASPGLENVASSSLEKLLQLQPVEVRTAAEPLLKRINADLETQRARLAELSQQLDGGDPKNGAIIFQMTKTACSSCHKVGARGTAVGPDLTKVGQIRSRADLLEAVVYPSASFVRNYESVAVETDDGRVVTGLLSRETPEAVYIRTPQREEVRIARSDVETIAPSKLSIMPQGLDKVLTPAELRDLIAYLQSLK